MKIAINATFRLHGGSLTHLRHILKEWTVANSQNEYLLLTIPQNLAKLGKIYKPELNYKILKMLALSPFIKLLWEQLVLPFYLSREKVDVLFCPGNICPLFPLTKTVVMLQHAGPFSDSISLNHAGLYQKAWLKALGLMMKLSANRANHIIFISQHFQECFLRECKLLSNKGTVIYMGRNTKVSRNYKDEKEEQNVLQEFGVDGSYILFVSHLDTHRNVIELIGGFHKAIKIIKNEKIKLVIAGRIMYRSYFLEIIKTVKKCSLRDQAIFLGEVPHHKLTSLYANCLLFIFPSTCESFGNVLLEVLAQGVPILCSNLSVMPEICGDAALYFNPYDTNDIAQKITLMVNNRDLRESLRKKALKQAQKFPTWEEVAKKTLELLEEIAQK